MIFRKLIPSFRAFQPFLRLTHIPKMNLSEILRKEREPKFFCHQCAQTSDGVYCDIESVCGKTVEQSKLQALMLNLNQMVSQYIQLINDNKAGLDTLPYAQYLLETTFSSLTNVNFDESQAMGYISRLTQMKNELKNHLQKNGFVVPQHLLDNDFVYKNDPVYLTNEGRKHAVWMRFEKEPNPDGFSLREFIRYGLKGASAYLNHVERIRAFTNKPIPEYSDQDRREIFDGMTRGWVKMEEPKQSVEQLFDECMRFGGVNLRVMRALSNGHATTLGVPEPSVVHTRPVPGKSILVSGHDMIDLMEILQQTEGKGINVYTHGEMAPGHSYPELKKFKHLKGNLGGAWYNQGKDFGIFKGAILMTSNCLTPPKATYQNRLFTTGSVGFKDIPHVPNGNFKQVIDCALNTEGLTQEYIDKNYPENKCKDLTIGFGHKTVLGIADVVIKSIQQGILKNIFLIGGCDGFEPQRQYFTDLAAASPNSSLILTMGCAKYRVNKLNLGNLGNTGIPRVLDMGQCNDSYSAVVVALELAKALGTNVNSLPLHLAFAWFEQKAVAVLMTLLHLGIRDIRVGPMAPAFLSPGVMKMLNEKFNLSVAHPKDVMGDLDQMLAKK